MVALIKAIFFLGPLIFGLAFLAPLIAQIISLAGWTPPFGLSALATGLIIGGLYGSFAQTTGRWI